MAIANIEKHKLMNKVVERIISQGDSAKEEAERNGLNYRAVLNAVARKKDYGKVMINPAILMFSLYSHK